MKKLYIYITILIGTILFASCQKDIDVLTATIEDYHGNNGKVYIHDRYACWHNGDAVKINGADLNIQIKESSNGNLGQAYINIKGLSSPYLAIYPSTAVGQNSKINVDPIQKYKVKPNPNGVDVQVIDAIMVGYTNNDNLNFHNIEALMAIHVPAIPGKNIDVRSIELIALDNDVYLSGSVTMNINSDVIPELALTSGGNSIKLNVDPNKGIIPSAGKTFYISIPPVTSRFQVKINYVNTNDNKIWWYISDPSISNTIESNKIYPMEINYSYGSNEEVGFTGGDGSSEDQAYLIRNEDDLLLLQEKSINGHNTFSNKYFKQTSSFNIATLSGIGSDDFPFCGKYDGGGNTITFTNSDQLGIFDVVGNNANIKNLTVVNKCNIASVNMGGLIGKNTGTNVCIDNCTIKGETVSLIDGIIGGICGSNYGEIVISNCINEMGLVGNDRMQNGHRVMGGICGYNNGRKLDILNCLNKSNFSIAKLPNKTISFVVGGIVGESNMGDININMCKNLGSVSVLGLVTDAIQGGLIGLVSSSVNIKNSVNHGTLARSSCAGGLVGEGATVTIENSYVDGSFTNCTNAGGIVGKITGTLTLSNVYTGSAVPTSGIFAWIVPTIPSNTVTSAPSEPITVSGITCTNVFYPTGSSKPVVGTHDSYKNCNATTIKADTEPADSYMSTLNTAATAHVGWSDWYWSGQARLSCFPH